MPFNDLSQALTSFSAVTGKTAVWTGQMPVLQSGGIAGSLGTVCAMCRKNGIKRDCGFVRSSSIDYCVCENGNCFIWIRLENLFGGMLFGPVDPAADSLNDCNDVCLAFLETLLREGLLPRENRLFSELTAYVHEHISEPIDTGTLSSRFFVSACTLSRLTLTYAGLPLRKYITSLRLREARELLLSSDYSIKEIAEKVGITDYNYFSRLYSKHYLRTPSEDRKTRKTLSGANVFRI